MDSYILISLLNKRDDMFSKQAALKIAELEIELTAIRAGVKVLIETSKVSRELRLLTKDIYELNS